MDSKSELYSQYYAGIECLADQLMLSKEEKKLFKNKVHQAIKQKKNIISLKDLSYEDMHHLVSELYEFIPIEFTLNEKNSMVKALKTDILECLTTHFGYNFNSAMGRAELIADLCEVPVADIRFDKESRNSEINDFIEYEL